MKNKIFILAVEVWARALIIYLSVTLVSLVIPIMYFYSMGLALLWSIPGLFAFYGILCVLHSQKPVPGVSFNSLLFTTPLIAFGCTWLAAFHFTNASNTWEAYQNFCLFPIAGIASSIVAVVTAKDKLIIGLYGVSIENDEVALLLNHTIPTHEN